MHALQLTGQGSVSLFDLVGDCLSHCFCDDVADLIRHARVEDPEPFRQAPVLIAWVETIFLQSGAALGLIANTSSRDASSHARCLCSSEISMLL